MPTRPPAHLPPQAAAWLSSALEGAASGSLALAAFRTLATGPLREAVLRFYAQARSGWGRERGPAPVCRAACCPPRRLTRASPPPGQASWHSRRLLSLGANAKFSGPAGAGPADSSAAVPAPPEGLRRALGQLRADHGLRHILVWHAMFGYWGGCMPGVGVGRGGAWQGGGAGGGRAAGCCRFDDAWPLVAAIWSLLKCALSHARAPRKPGPGPGAPGAHVAPPALPTGCARGGPLHAGARRRRRRQRRRHEGAEPHRAWCACKLAVGAAPSLSAVGYNPLPACSGVQPPPCLQWAHPSVAGVGLVAEPEALHRELHAYLAGGVGRVGGWVGGWGC